MNRQRRVVFIHDSNEYGGMERHMLMLMRHMDRNRYEPLLAVPGYTDRNFATPPLFIEETRDLGVQVIRPPDPSRYGLLSYVADINNIRRLFNAHGVDLAHIHTNLPTRVRKFTLAARASSTRAVVRSEHLPPTHFGTSAFTPWLIKPFDLMTDAFMVGSQSCLDEQIVAMGRDPRKLHCLIYGIELSRFNPQHDTRAAKARLGLDPELPLVCAIGRLSPLKGHSYLIEAARRVTADYGRAQFMIVGDGWLRDELARQVAESGLGDVIRLAGYQQDTIPAMQATDIAVMPTSINEGISLAMLEFMAMGKPVIATDDPSFEETVVHEQSGLIVPKADSAALAAAILRLLRAPDLAARLAGAGLEVVRGKFNIQRQVQQVMALYDTLLAEPGRARRTVRRTLPTK